MKRRIKCTFHFERDSDTGLDDGHIRRGIEETIELLQMRHQPWNPTQVKAMNAMLEGFTLEQADLFFSMVIQRIGEREQNAVDMPVPMGAVLLEDLNGIVRRWRLVADELIDAYRNADAQVVTGLEVTRTDIRKEGKTHHHG